MLLQKWQVKCFAKTLSEMLQPLNILPIVKPAHFTLKPPNKAIISQLSFAVRVIFFGMDRECCQKW